MSLQLMLPEPPPAQNLDRCRESLAGHVLAFWQAHRGRTGERAQFHGEDLLAYIRARVPAVAPDSPRRVLADLRRSGVLNYRLLDRQASLFQALDVEPLPIRAERRDVIAELRRELRAAHEALDAAGIPHSVAP